MISKEPRRWPVRPVAELYADTQIGGVSNDGGAVGSVLQEATVYSGLLGGIWRVSENLDVDSAVRAASVNGLWNLEVRLGLTWRVQ